MLTIGQLAKEADVPVSTVRYYEGQKLLDPEGRTAPSTGCTGLTPCTGCASSGLPRSVGSPSRTLRSYSSFVMLTPTPVAKSKNSSAPGSTQSRLN